MVVEARHVRDRAELEGPAGNERLTAWAGAVLLVLLAVEGVTILGIHRMVVPHVVVGLLLVGPLALKMSTTGYRFLRYYTRSPQYRASGPPRPLMRMLAPFVVLTTLVVIISGVGLLVVPQSLRGPVLGAHKAGFVLWFVVTSVHVLVYLWRVPRLVGADLGAVLRLTGSMPRGVGLRAAAVVVAIAVGAVLAVALAPRAQPWATILLQR